MFNRVRLGSLLVSLFLGSQATPNALAQPSQLFGSRVTATAVQYYGANQLDYVALGGPGQAGMSGTASVFGARASGSGSLQNAVLRATASAEERRSHSGISHGAGVIVEVWDRVILRSDTDLTSLFIPMQFEVGGNFDGPDHYREARFEYSINNRRYSFTAGEQQVLTDQLMLPPPGEEIYYDLRFKLSVTAYGGGDGSGLADFGNSFYIRWNLPEGVQARSVSGVFNPPPIPEPGVAAGAVLLTLVLRRARRRVETPQPSTKP